MVLGNEVRGDLPFLGHILSEAGRSSGTATWSGHRTGGRAPSVDDHGKEFHYKVTACKPRSDEHLTFQLDRDSDRMREMLQKVREKALAEGTRAKRTTAAASEARRTGTDLYDLLGRLRATGLSPGAERHRRRGHRRVRRVADERRARRALVTASGLSARASGSLRGRASSPCVPLAMPRWDPRRAHGVPADSSRRTPSSSSNTDPPAKRRYIRRANAAQQALTSSA